MSKKDKQLISLAEVNGEMLAQLHRQWIWADKMRMQYEEGLKKRSAPVADLENYIISAEWVLMMTWYALLFTLCEFIKNNQISIPEIDAPMRSVYGDLKLFRNAILHIQSKYWSNKLFEIFKDRTSALKIRQVHGGLGKALLDEITSKQSLL